MAKFAFTTSGHFVNMDLITTMRVKGDPAAVDTLEVWFAGNPHRESGLFLGGNDARQLIEEFLKTHDVVGWPEQTEEK